MQLLRASLQDLLASWIAGAMDGIARRRRPCVWHRVWNQVFRSQKPRRQVQRPKGLRAVFATSAVETEDRVEGEEGWMRTPATGALCTEAPRLWVGLGRQ